MKMFLLQSKGVVCQDCGSQGIVIVRAPSEERAREIARKSNSCGTFVAGIDWSDPTEADCFEYPLLDGPEGIIVGNWFEQHLAG